MESKTYFASSVPAALEAARKDLGPEAMLVNSRPAPESARSMGRLEVTFTYDPAQKPPAQAVRSVQFPVVSNGDAPREKPVSQRSMTPSTREPNSGTSPFAALRNLAPGQQSQRSSDLDEIREQLAEIRRSMNSNPRLPEAPANAPGEALPDALLSRLIQSGIDPEFARTVVADSSRRPGDRRDAVAAEITSRISVVPFAGDASQRILALAGPPGRGKSLSVAKIAFRYGLAARVPVQILSAGDHGVGGTASLARYAQLLAIPYKSCDSYPTLDLLLKNRAANGLIVIDTPGISVSQTTDLAALASFFAGHPEIEKHLVLRADTRSVDMCHAAGRFAGMKPDRLLFTCAEEAMGLGAMLETLMRTSIPGTFVGTGREIPGTLEELDCARLVQSVCGGRSIGAAAA